MSRPKRPAFGSIRPILAIRKSAPVSNAVETCSRAHSTLREMVSSRLYTAVDAFPHVMNSGTGLRRWRPAGRLAHDRPGADRRDPPLGDGAQHGEPLRSQRRSCQRRALGRCLLRIRPTGLRRPAGPRGSVRSGRARAGRRRRRRSAETVPPGTLRQGQITRPWCPAGRGP